jgi:hypothetical protein
MCQFCDRLVCYISCLSRRISTFRVHMPPTSLHGVTSQNANVWTIPFVERGHLHRGTVEPDYNDFGLRDTSPNAADILWYQLIRRR